MGNHESESESESLKNWRKESDSHESAKWGIDPSLAMTHVSLLPNVIRRARSTINRCGTSLRVLHMYIRLWPSLSNEVVHPGDILFCIFSLLACSCDILFIRQKKVTEKEVFFGGGGGCGISHVTSRRCSVKMHTQMRAEKAAMQCGSGGFTRAKKIPPWNSQRGGGGGGGDRCRFARGGRGRCNSMTKITQTADTAV